MAGNADVAGSEPTVALTERELVLKRLLAAHETWFDVAKDYGYAGETFDGFAEFRSTGQKYILSKKHELWHVNTFEYLFFKGVERLTAADVAHWYSFMTTEALGKVNPDENHMTSYLSLVLVADVCDDEALRAVRKAKFRKNFAYGMRGWADLRLCVVDLGGRSVITNAAGKQMTKTLEANAGFAGESPANRRR